MSTEQRNQLGDPDDIPALTHGEVMAARNADTGPPSPTTPAPLPGIPPRPEWMPRGLCADPPDWVIEMAEQHEHRNVPAMFYIEKGGQRATAAKAVCARCPVQTECLDHALTEDERFGVWGGMSGLERQRERRRRGMTAVYQPAKCGTYSGYRRHDRASETPCEPCRSARNQYEALRRAQRRAAS